MGIKYVNLYREMNDKNISTKELAELTHTSETIFMQKLQGLTPFTLSDAVKICNFFKTSDVELLFLQLDSIT